MSGPSLTSYNDDAQRSWLHQVKSLQLSNETEGERGVLRRQSSLSENSSFFFNFKKFQWWVFSTSPGVVSTILLRNSLSLFSFITYYLTNMF